MAIQILPPLLANQIAAGEVVERPASVVKELVENCLDAGADRIEIEVEKGGAKLIRIRDNGGGIPKDELTLALSRHATSKVATLADLEGIASLGFRGEALASISAVSRLTLTSRPADQAEAWQAQAEGRDMAVTVRPAAHPVGTTVEVLDLFFNTPARRKFLRSEKTEFAHIDELIRRLALSRFDVSFVLRHNGKPVRQYRAASDPAAGNRRVAVACGERFIQQALTVRSEHHGLLLHGWLVPPQADGSPATELQYSYVNGRMMRDKLINHAIRQACVEALGLEQAPAYVLYLELDPRQVDVNVHPAKHEVRFHEARLVHDFLLQVLREALLTTRPQTQDEPSASQWQIAETPAYPDSPLRPKEHGYHGAGFRAAPAVAGGRGPADGERLPQAALAYQQLMSSPDELASTSAVTGTEQLWLPVLLQPPHYLLVRQGERLGLCHLGRLERHLLQQSWRQRWVEGLVSQPLLMPLRLSLSAAQQAVLGSHAHWLTTLGLEFKPASTGTIMVYRVPAALRQSNLADTLPALLERLAPLTEQAPSAIGDLCHWLATQAVAGRRYDLSLAEGLLRQWQQGQAPWPAGCYRALPIEQWIQEWEHE
ncbi:DNA mismatch repair endonuclease MutL [Pseudaeromonas paramecii]|uniref:DNA mismatch repair protein MutL n=1 Tax=Pseudaeromonas paramecii TaxID=2138166 RepID=A0ABP8QC80_9GAMM